MMVSYVEFRPGSWYWIRKREGEPAVVVGPFATFAAVDADYRTYEPSAGYWATPYNASFLLDAELAINVSLAKTPAQFRRSVGGPHVWSG